MQESSFWRIAETSYLMAKLANFRLVVFRAVAEQLSFRKAAEELYLTQPAVSLQIKALEEDLSVQLFDRTASRIALTGAGEILIDYVRQIDALLDSAQQALAAVGGELAGKLSLGASTTISQYVLPRLIGEFRKQHPRVSATLVTGNTEQIVQAILDQELSIGFIEGPPRARDVAVEPFLVDELLLIVPAGHEWSEQGSIAPQQLAHAPLLMRERGSGTRHVIEMTLAKHGLRRSALNVIMELDSVEAIKSAVEAGLGVGFVSRWALAKDSRTGVAFSVVEVEKMRISRELLIVYPAGPDLHGIAADFRRFILGRTRATKEKQPAASAPRISHKKSK